MSFCFKCGKKMVDREIQGKSRVACPKESCGYVFWDSPTAVVAGLVEHDNRIILARNKSWPEKVYGLVTGFLEKGEAPEAAVAREVEEELGLAGQVISLIGIYPFPMMNQLIIAYYLSAEGVIRIGEELAEVKVIEPEKLKPWGFGTGLAVGDWLEHHWSGQAI